MEGNSLFTTTEAIGDQNYTMVKMTWKADFIPGYRIYCMIDPDNNLAENREDNNLGWTPVQRFSPGCSIVSGVDNKHYNSASNGHLLKIYPNPAGKVIYFDYSGPAFVGENISLVNMNGMILKTIPIINTEGLSFLSLDTTGLNPGTYMVILKQGIIYNIHSW